MKPVLIALSFALMFSPLASGGAVSAGLSKQPGVLAYASIRDSGESVPSDPDDFTDLFEGRSPEQVSWSPDGCCLAFSAERKGERSGQHDLYLVSVRGGRARRLTASPGYDLAPDWRP